MRNGIAAAASSLLLRFCGMVFNVYLSGNAGAEAMGLMSLIYSVWGFVLTAGCAGGSLASARISSEARVLGEDEFKGAERCILYSFISALTIGGIFAFSARGIAAIMSESRVLPSFYVLAASLPFIGISGSLCGYFDSTSGAYKNSVIRIAEQTVRMAVTVVIMTFMKDASPEKACLAIISGGAAAEFFSFICLSVLFLREKNKLRLKGGRSTVKMKRISGIVVPISLSAGIRSGLVSIEHMLIPRGLVRYGHSSREALEFFGVAHGMALPVILFCIAIPSSFANLLIPGFARESARGNNKEISYMISRAYRAAFCFSIGVAAFLVMAAYMIGELLYPGTGSSRYIYMFAPLVPVMYIDSVSDALLKGTGRQLYSMKVNILDALISVGLVFVLVPRIGINGYIVAIYASEIFNTAISYIKVHRETGYSVPIIRFILAPLAFSLAAAAISRCVPLLLGGGAVSAVISGVVFLLSYALILSAFGNVNNEERGYIRRIFGITEK